MGGTGASPCASCKLLRRRCAKECVFAPYFPAEDPNKFAIVHKVFGASNVSKMLQDLPLHQRADAVSSLVYEAHARLRDPVYGCVGAISHLQHQVSQLQMQLAVTQAEMLCLQMQFNNNINNNDSNDNNEVFVQKEIDEKSIFMQNGSLLSGNYNGFGPQVMNGVSFSPSGGNTNVGFLLPQENLKRESLWT